MVVESGNLKRTGDPIKIGVESNYKATLYRGYRIEGKQLYCTSLGCEGRQGECRRKRAAKELPQTEQFPQIGLA